MKAHSAGAILCLAVSLPASGQAPIPDADRLIKLGTRTPPLPPGEGGQLTLTAPPEFCANATHLLEVRFFPTPGREQPVVRVPAGPSACRWEFDGMAEGYYDAIIQVFAAAGLETPSVERDGPIVAQARGQVFRGATTLMALESSDVEVEGRVTGELSVPGAVRLAFEKNGGMGGRNRWTTPLNADGSYRIRLGGFDREDQVCVSAQPSGRNGAEPAEPLGSVHLKCARFVHGLQRLDFDDVHLPPGIVRIEVPASDDAAFDAFAALAVSAAGSSSPSILTGFKLLRGVRGEYFSDFRAHEFLVMSHDRQRVLASSQIRLSSERPVRTVTLTIGAAR